MQVSGGNNTDEKAASHVDGSGVHEVRKALC